MIIFRQTQAEFSTKTQQRAGQIIYYDTSLTWFILTVATVALDSVSHNAILF